MTTVENLQLLNFGSDLLPDKVIYRKEVTYTVPAATTIGDYTEFSFPHELPSIPLLIGSYSDDGFATSYDYGAGPYGTLTAFGFDSFTMLAHVWSTATHVFIRVQSHNTSRSVTFRIIGLSAGIRASTPRNIEVPPVQDNLLFDGDSNTLKHATWSQLTMTTNGLGTYVSQTYTSTATTPYTLFCFVLEDGKLSYLDTMNTITNSGVYFSALTRPGFLQVAVAGSTVKDVVVVVKTYLDA